MNTTRKQDGGAQDGAETENANVQQHSPEDVTLAKRLETARLVSDVFVFLLPALLLAAVVATHISPVVTPGFAEPQRVLESSASFIILTPILFVSLIALYIECVAEPAVAHFIARGRSRASKAGGARRRALAMFGRGFLLTAVIASTVALVGLPGPDGNTNRLIRLIGVGAAPMPLVHHPKARLRSGGDGFTMRGSE